MKATIVDLRYRMNDVLKALERNEEVTILHRGRRRGVIRASGLESPGKTEQHAFFNMKRGSGTVEGQMTELRGGRHRDL